MQLTMSSFNLDMNCEYFTFTSSLVTIESQSTFDNRHFNNSNVAAVAQQQRFGLIYFVAVAIGLMKDVSSNVST